MIGRNIGQRLLTVAVVVGLLAMTLGIGAVTAQDNESDTDSVDQYVETGDDTENVSVENESTQTVDETETETETSFSSSGLGDAADDGGDVVDFGDDFTGADFANDIVDQTLGNVGSMFE